MHRRRFLQLSATATAFPSLTRIARAQAYPSQPLRWVVGFPPGGGADTVSRIMARWLSERLGQPVVIENKPGASTNISVQAVANAPPDGYTILFIGASAAVNVTLFDNLPFNLLRDIAPVSGLIDFPFVLIVHPSVPARTVAEFIAYAKANPGKINMASAGTGTSVHLSGEMFMAMADIKMQHVPYRGAGPAVTDMLGGQVQVIFDSMPSIIPHIRSGALRALAVTSATRSSQLPDTPAIADTVPGYEASALFGMGAPRNTPKEIVEKLNKEINAVLAEPGMTKQIVELGGDALIGTPEAFGAMIVAETEKWKKVIEGADIKKVE